MGQYFYKVVCRRMDGKLRSFKDHGNGFTVFYKENKPVKAKYGTKLLVFRCLTHARSFKEIYGSDITNEIWRCTVTNPVPIRFLMRSFGTMSTRHTREEWKLLKTNPRAKMGWWFESPKGTYGADSVTLVDKVLL